MALPRRDPMDALFAEKSNIEGLLAGLARETRVLVHLTDSEGRGTATAHQREGLGDVADTGEGGARPPPQLTRCVRAGQGFATKIQVCALLLSGRVAGALQSRWSFVPYNFLPVATHDPRPPLGK